MIERLEAPTKLWPDQLQLPPLQICVCEQDIRTPTVSSQILDAIVEVRWENRSFQFGVEYKSRSTPSMFAMAINQLMEQARQTGLYPLLVMPYLSEEQLYELERRSMSGIDLCGNGIVIVPDQLFVFRTGQPNRFVSSAPIKNVYRKNSSLGARVFLLRPQYQRVNDIYEEVARRGGKIALSTVSKTLRVLEEDLIVGRKSGTIRLLQPEKLLERLVVNFEQPQISRSFTGKVNISQEMLATALVDAARRQGMDLVATGVGSVSRYAVMAKEERLSFYCTNIDRLLTQLPAVEDPFFPNIELLETEDETVYFDVRYQEGFPWASPLQTYLELMTGEKRARETADQVRALVLRELAEQGT